MELTHGIALLFELLFTVVAAIFKKMLWWLLVIGYTFTLAWMAIVNEWEILFFVPLAIIGVISIIAFIFTVTRGDLI